ncbi:response regulator [Mesorhizobium sp. Cs1299R1N1]|uniref:response regulator transcription factor n=1 Tax=unclassified Mesorhizobium TaxID=325217 RepID=UPI00301C5CC5
MIAIVDDDGAVRTSTANLMRSAGYEAISFASGEELLDSARLNQVNCVITDVQMPGMSGLKLQDALLARRYKRPIIFITAYPEERDRRQAFCAGALAFFSKPFDGTEMLECVSKAVNAQSDSRPDETRHP